VTTRTSSYSFSDAKRRGLKDADALTEVLVADPITLPIAYVIATRTKVHPIAVSVFAFIMRLGAAGLFITGGLVPGAVFAFVGFLLDGVDGKIRPWLWG
jgi:hypothetical protein